jgi:hypothetical protein
MIIVDIGVSQAFFGLRSPDTMMPKKTMIKDKCGAVRRCAYNLPSDTNAAHAFGKEVGRDEEGAGAGKPILHPEAILFMQLTIFVYSS